VGAIGAGFAHAESWHRPLPQSASWVQCSFSGHGPQLPPQSTSVSEPLARPSLQVGAATHTPASHSVLSQSLGALQVAPFAHTGQSPPQALPVADICVVHASIWIGLVSTGSGAMPKLGTEHAPNKSSASEPREIRLIPEIERSQRAMSVNETGNI
jgi:hypothetical protein